MIKAVGWKTLGSTVAESEIAKDFFILYRLAEMGACSKTVKISTSALARTLGLSQQSVSRRLIEMERKGLIQRTVTGGGSLIRISELGENYLRGIYLGLGAIFEGKPQSITVEGRVFSGLGEGAYYVSKEMYRKQFIEKLGFDPYPGTLNLKISSEQNAKLKAKLDAYPGIEIEGFKNRDRTYGSVKCFRAIIEGKEQGAVVLALRSHYGKDVIEIIAPEYLRGRLGLRDGDKVRVEVFV
jgi:riboflavin kinase